VKKRTKAYKILVTKLLGSQSRITLRWVLQIQGVTMDVVWTWLKVSHVDKTVADSAARRWGVQNLKNTKIYFGFL